MTTLSAKTVVEEAKPGRKCAEYVYDARFEDPAFTRTLIADIDLPKAEGRAIRLTRKQEQDLFLRFNYARYRASKSTGKRAAEWGQRAANWKAILAWHNLPLCITVSRKYASTTGLDPDDLLAEAHAALNRALGGFDVGRGLKFSTYLVNGINNAMWRAIEVARKHKAIAVPELEAGNPRSGVDVHNVDLRMDLDRMVFKAGLSAQEQYVLLSRYGCLGDGEHTLQSIGDCLGLSYERVRQIQNLAIAKIRKCFGDYDPKAGFVEYKHTAHSKADCN